MNTSRFYLLFFALGVLALTAISHSQYTPVSLTAETLNGVNYNSANPVTLNVVSGTSIPISITVTGGTGNYIINWTADSQFGFDCPGTGIPTPTDSATSVLTQTINYVPSATNSPGCTIRANVIDSAANPADITPNNFTIDDFGVINAFAPITDVVASPSTATTISVNTPVQVSVSFTGGSIQTYSWTINSVNNNCPGFTDPGSTNTFSYTPNAATTDCAFDVLVSDPMFGSTFSNTTLITVTSTPQPLTVNLIASNTIADAGQIIVLNTSISGGVGPFTYNFFNVTLAIPSQISSCTNLSTPNCVLTANTGSTPLFATYNVVVTDAGTDTIQSSLQQSVTINLAPFVFFPSVAGVGPSSAATNSTANTVTLTVPSGREQYICAGASNTDWLTGVSWAATTQDANVFALGDDSANTLGAFTSIGIQSGNICSASTTTLGPDLAVAGIGLNNVSTYTENTFSNSTTTNTFGVASQQLSYIITAPN